MIPFIEILDRAHIGPMCEVKDWDIKVIPSKVKEKLKEYGLEKTCAPENPVNTDDGLADKYWEAGFELAVDLGMLCLDTKRVIKFNEDELKDVISEAPREFVLGKNENQVIYKSRNPEDKIIPVSMFGPMGIGFDEDLVVPIIQSCAQYRVIDVVINPLPIKMYGREIRTGTPYETLASKYEAYLAKEAHKKAERFGMPWPGFKVSATEYGQLGGYGIKDGPDVGIVLPITELKTSYALLHKTAHDIVNHEGMDWGNHWSMIGGYVGPAEGAAVTAVAATLLLRAVHYLFSASGLILDMRYSGNSGRDAVWASGISQQAQNRNTNVLTHGFTSQVFGPCTYELLYETAVTVITDVTSGVAGEFGTRPTACKYPNYASGLENKFAAEVMKSSAGLNRVNANEIVKVLLPKYVDRLQRPEKGKSFTECCDIKTLKPTKEWQEIYDRVWKELEDLGLPRLY